MEGNHVQVTGTPNERDDERDQPSIRQKVHSATGDRDAEAEALADRADDEVDVKDAKAAVARAHGDRGDDETPSERDLATPDDAAEAARDRARKR